MRWLFLALSWMLCFENARARQAETPSLCDESLRANNADVSVSFDGDYAILGLPVQPADTLKSGMAYIFHQRGGEWRLQAKLPCRECPAGAFFGKSVALDGEYAIVGAPRANAEQEQFGAAFVFKRAGDHWREQAKLTAAEGTARDYFGFSVAIGARYAVVGAPEDDARGARSGAAYIYLRRDEAWALQDIIRAPDGSVGNYFGFLVSIVDGHIIVGEAGSQTTDSTGGAIYVFKTGSGKWVQESKLQLKAANRSHYGFSLFVDPEHFAITSPELREQKQKDIPAFIFKRQERKRSAHK